MRWNLQAEHSTWYEIIQESQFFFLWKMRWVSQIYFQR